MIVDWSKILYKEILFQPKTPLWSDGPKKAKVEALSPNGKYVYIIDRWHAIDTVEVLDIFP